jgi:hypothetical protein
MRAEHLFTFCASHFRMDPSQSNVGEGSQGQFSGGNMNAYQPAWNPYMYGYQAPPGWFPQGFQPRPPNVAMVNPSGCVPEGFRQAEIAGPNVQYSEPDLEEVEVPAPRGKTRKKNQSLGQSWVTSIQMKIQTLLSHGLK